MSTYPNLLRTNLTQPNLTELWSNAEEEILDAQWYDGPNQLKLI
jgi:hypothetical protein